MIQLIVGGSITEREKTEKQLYKLYNLRGL